MNGVDKFDQYSTNYKYAHKNSKWYFVIWNFLIETALVNGRIAYSMATGNKIFVPNYSHAVIQGMIDNYSRPLPAKRG
jgi:hypothetical protein